MLLSFDCRWQQAQAVEGGYSMYNTGNELQQHRVPHQRLTRSSSHASQNRWSRARA